MFKVIYVISINSYCSKALRKFLNGFAYKFDNILLHRSKNNLNYVLGPYGG